MTEMNNRGIDEKIETEGKGHRLERQGRASEAHLGVEAVVQRLRLREHLSHAVGLLRVPQQLGQEAVALGVQRLQGQTGALGAEWVGCGDRKYGTYGKMWRCDVRMGTRVRR